MRASRQVTQLSLDETLADSYPFPPLGFFAISEGANGYGDTFGLYWPIGREQREPLVAESWHQDWWVKPTYSSIDKFLLALNRAERNPEPLTLEEDPTSPRLCLERAGELIAATQLNAAQTLLEKAIEILPEYTDALTALWSIHVRMKRLDIAAPLAIRAIISPPCFGFRAFKPLRWLRTADVPGELRDDPVWRRRNSLTLEFGGTKHNDNYPLLLGAIEDYVAQAKYEMAVTLMQTYAEFMVSETTAFQDRYKFDRKEFKRWQCKLSEKLPGGPRNEI